jgi:uncharacterized membrane protein
MNLILLILLIFAIIQKIFPSKKPNYMYGYQLGSAKKSMEHWRIANRHAANYLIILYGFLLLLSVVFEYIQYDGGLLLLGILIPGLIAIYIVIERKLKQELSEAKAANHI